MLNKTTYFYHFINSMTVGVFLIYSWYVKITSGIVWEDFYIAHNIIFPTWLATKLHLLILTVCDLYFNLTLRKLFEMILWSFFAASAIAWYLIYSEINIKKMFFFLSHISTKLFCLFSPLGVAPLKVQMPALSPTMEEGNIVKWLKKEGKKLLETPLNINHLFF